MGEKKQIVEETKQVHWAAAVKKNEVEFESMESSGGSINNDSISSSFSSSLSSSDLDDDASSSSSSSPSTSSNSPPSCGPLFELAELMAQLPIKRGLSKFYHGKSQTFASLADVSSIEDLGKKETNSSYSRRMRPCKSYGGNLNKFGPKATITKRSPRRSISPS